MLHRPLFPLRTSQARGEFIQNWDQAGLLGLGDR